MLKFVENHVKTQEIKVRVNVNKNQSKKTGH